MSTAGRDIEGSGVRGTPSSDCVEFVVDWLMALPRRRATRECISTDEAQISEQAQRHSETKIH